MTTRQRQGAAILAAILAVDFLAFAYLVPSPVLDRAPTSGSAAAPARPAIGANEATSSPGPGGARLVAPSATAVAVGPTTSPRGTAASSTAATRPPSRTPAPTVRPRTRATTKPTRTPAAAAPYAVWSGRASWYDDGPGLYAAVPGWRGSRFALTVRLRGSSGPCDTAHHCVVVQVRDWCGCYVGDPRNERAIDLSPAAFARLAPLSRGIANVVITGSRRR